jgi:hypothetical protein
MLQIIPYQFRYIYIQQVRCILFQFLEGTNLFGCNVGVSVGYSSCMCIAQPTISLAVFSISLPALLYVSMLVLVFARYISMPVILCSLIDHIYRAMI